MGEVELREHIESLIRHEREMREDAERRTAHALSIQSREYERRLDELNHAHAAALAARLETEIGRAHV